MSWNKVKNNTHFKHYKGGDYDFIAVVLPFSEKPFKVMPEQKVFHTELGEWVTLYNLPLPGGNSVSFSDYDEYFVLYQSHEDLNAESLYLRPLEMFFDSKESIATGMVKRFKNMEGYTKGDEKI
jgi:hypothetical protein